MTKFKEIKCVELLDSRSNQKIEVSANEEECDGKVIKLECHIVAPKLLNIRKTVLWSEGLQDGIEDIKTLSYSGSFLIHW